MCRAVEELIQEEKEETREATREEMIIEFLKLGKLTFEEIAVASKVSVEVVKQIAEKVTVRA